jgi:hypothetical protein
MVGSLQCLLSAWVCLCLCSGVASFGCGSNLMRAYVRKSMGSCMLGFGFVCVRQCIQVHHRPSSSFSVQ